MNRWAIRIILILMLMAFGLIFLSMYKQLVMLQRSQNPVSTTTRLSIGRGDGYHAHSHGTYSRHE